jgi:hypothetical protein|tara:strand:- start:1024 stop:1227 length:204 start_codon:yes stop_codon:yes gene_type:complete
MKGKTMTKIDLNKFCKFTDEIDSILSNVLEKITKFEKDNDIELCSEDISYTLDEVTDTLNDSYNQFD